MKELGRRIRSQRKSLGLSQTELGKRVGRSHGQISNLERGLTETPPAELLTALAVELKESPATYHRLAGRTILAAEQVIPSNVADLPPETAAAVERAVERAIAPLVARIDLLLEQLSQRPDGP